MPIEPVERLWRRFHATRLFPGRWPVRKRIAAVSAAITFVILVAFALVVGRLVSDQLTREFRDELRSSAAQLAVPAQAEIVPTVEGPGLKLQLRRPITDVPLSDAAIRVVNQAGVPLPVIDQAGVPRPDDQVPEPDLGPPAPGEIVEVGDYEVAAEPIEKTTLGGPVYVQYARSTVSLDTTIGRLWLFLIGGVLGGAVLAALAGFAVAGRAMRPVTSLTATAREIAATRDPSTRIPMPESEDEVAELARILDEMLRELDAARSETEHMVQAQREFVADASHELRTPLTSILANLELLQDSIASGMPNGEEAEIVDGALRSSRRMRVLVSDLLLLARADAGRSGVRRPCDIGGIAASAREEVRAFAPDHELVLDVTERLTVDGNPEELHRLILNLLENAVRHTPAGTEIRTTLERHEADAVLVVADDGPGLPPELGDQVFARFVRGGGPADVATDAGTGLGLAIVKAVAETHGGTVGAGSSESGGARFEVRLPLSETVRPAPTGAGTPR